MAMGIWLPGGGGGASSDDCTLLRAAVPAGMKAVTADSDDEAMKGTLNADTTLADSQALSGQTFLKWNPQTKLFEKHTGNMANKGAWNSRIGINGKIMIPAGYHNGSGYVDQALTVKGAATYTPGRSNQVIGANQWLSGAQTILGDPNLKPENIKKGVPIFGNMGTHEGYVTSPLNLFNKGVWSNLQTSGITETWKWDNGSYSNTYPVIEAINSVILMRVAIRNDQASTQYKCNARLNSTVNLSDYKYLKFNVNHTGDFQRIYFGVSKNSNLQAFTYDSVYSETTEITGVKVVDISRLSGDYFIYLGFETTYETTHNEEYYVDKIFLSNT
jgi:hypothetical protein|nr:MAG TPA: tail protein [Bacteriophage sp.]